MSNDDYLLAYKGKRVMITGGLGFVGSNLAHRLVELGADVLLVDSLIPNYGGNLFNIAAIRDRVQVNVADTRDRNAMNYLVQGQDYIFNLAGQVSHLDSISDPVTDLEINCHAQLTLLEACRSNNAGVKIVYAGTRQVYGKPHYLPVDELHIVHPTDVNGINKQAGELYHIVYSNVYGMRTCSLRMTNTYGPHQYLRDARQGFIGWFVRLAVEGKTINIYGDGGQLRDLNYVDDAVDAFLRVGATDEANGQLFNLGGPPISLLELTKLIVELAGSAGGYQLIPWPAERKQIDIGDYYGDYGRLNRLTGWQPRTALEDGLRRMIEYYREYGAEHYF